MRRLVEPYSLSDQHLHLDRKPLTVMVQMGGATLVAEAIEDAYRRLVAMQDQIESKASEALNESETRFHILDRFLVEVLNWNRDNIQPEKAVTDGFVDYTLSAPDGRALMVVEAKRIGRLAVKTVSQKTSNLALRGSVLKTLLGPVKQASNYASLVSVPIACVTDGRCWLFFQTNRRDGVGVLDGKGIFFPSLASVLADFPKFHDLLSADGLQKRLGMVQLNRAEGLSAAGEESQAIVSPPDGARMHEQDALSQDATLLFKQFFSKITSPNDLEMLKNCFVETPESQKADLELQKIAQKLLGGIQAIDTAESKHLQSEIERAVISMQSETVLLVGNKGSGKSTFLVRFFSDVLHENLRRQCLVLHVSLDQYQKNEPLGLVDWTIRELIERADKELFGGYPTYDQLRGVFWDEYKRLREGPWAPMYASNQSHFRDEFGRYVEKIRSDQPAEYLRKLLKRAAHAENRLPCLVFDNADNFSPDVQDAIFQLANSFSSTSPVLNIVPITDRTVWRLAKVGALQSYSATSFYLPVPEAKEILRKRIAFVKSQLNEDPELAKSYFSKRGFRVTLANIERFAQAVERIFVDNDFVSGLIGRLANFDIRRMLLVAGRVFLSPEIRIDDVLKGSFGFRPGPSEIMRIHRAIIKGCYDRYADGENEYIYNLFWTDRVSPASPLLAYYILWTLKRRLSTARADSVDSRHWTAGELAQFFEATGTTQDQTTLIVQKLRDRGLVETLDPNVVSVSPGDRLAITEAGIAHVELTLSSTVYLEQMAMATGLNNQRIFREMRDLRDKSTAQSFTEIRRIFVDYVVELDTVRLSIPATPEYEALRDAKKQFRGRGSTPLAQQVIPPAKPVRDAPLESVGTILPRGRRR